MDSISSLVERNKGRLAFLLLMALAVIASSPLSFDTWFHGKDSIIHLIRSNDVCYEMRLGNFYPRWLSQASFGKGLPTLNFYPPALYLLVGYLNVLGVHMIPALVLVCAGSFLLSGWGMYLWTGKHCGELGALVAATIYLLAPYHLVDIYLRGALPEFLALAILPFLFHGIDLSLAPERTSRGIVYTGLASAAIVLTHNLTAVMILPFALAYFGWCCRHFGTPLKRCLAAWLGPLLGAGLSSFYWIPVIFERRYLAGTGVSIGGNLHYSRHFRTISDFFGTKEPDVFGFNSSYALIFICVALSFFALIATKEKSRGFGLLVLSCCLLSLVLVFPVAAPVYRALPVLQYLQFPYRFLGPATLFLSAFCAFALRPLSGRNAVAVAVFAAIVLLSIFLSAGLRRVEGPLPAFPANPVAFSANSYPIFRTWSDGDFIPADSTLARGDVVQFPALAIEGTIVPLANYKTDGARLTCKVALRQPADLVGPWLYFPGWQATCDKKHISVFPAETGLIAVTIPEGAHEIEIWFGTTWPRILGGVTAGITLGILVWRLYFGFRRKDRTI